MCNSLVVTGGDSCPRGCAFESRCQILDKSFLTFICCKIVVSLVKISQVTFSRQPTIKNYDFDNRFLLLMLRES